MGQDTKLPLCEAIIERLIHKSDPMRDSENAGMMHVSTVIEVVREGFAALTSEDLAKAIAPDWFSAKITYPGPGDVEMKRNRARNSAQAVMQLLRKE